MKQLNNILSFEDFITERLFKKSIDRVTSGDERKEDQMGNHTFTDGNGKTWKYGIKPANNIEAISYIIKIIEHTNYENGDVIDLNKIDMSDVTEISSLFVTAFYNIWNKNNRNFDINELGKYNYDTSGWDLRNCTNFKRCVASIKTDIGVDNWKVNPDNKAKLKDFEDSYYAIHPPKWLEINVKDWIKTCAEHPSYNKSGIDKQLTKQLGKKMYWVEFNESVHISFIPDNVIIYDIKSIKSGTCYIDITNLTSLKQLPTEFSYDPNRRLTRTLSVNLNKITDDEIIIPKGIDNLIIDKDDDITRLPKVIDYSISVFNEKQLGHIKKVNGDFTCGNTKITSLVGCPKEVTGNFDAHNSKITDLKGSPEHVGGDFTCAYTQIKSLKGCPKYIGDTFEFFNTQITEIDDFPEHVEKDIDMSGLKNLKNFIGLPEVINGNLNIGYCNVESLEGLPKEIKGALIIGKLTCNNKPVTVKDILEVSPDIKVIKENSYSKNLIG